MGGWSGVGGALGVRAVRLAASVGRVISTRRRRAVSIDSAQDRYRETELCLSVSKRSFKQ
jgi:hypothetical protein